MKRRAVLEAIQRVRLEGYEEPVAVGQWACRFLDRTQACGHLVVSATKMGLVRVSTPTTVRGMTLVCEVEELGAGMQHVVSWFRRVQVGGCQV